MFIIIGVCLSGKCIFCVYLGSNKTVTGKSSLNESYMFFIRRLYRLG